MKKKISLIALLSLTLLALSGAYIFYVRNVQQTDIAERNAKAAERIKAFEPQETSTTDTEQLAYNENPLIENGETLFINRVPGENYEKLAIRRSDGTRQILNQKCSRMHANETTAICLFQTTLGYKTKLLDLQGSTLQTTDQWSAVLPSRARMSPDGKWASTTMFASGSGYQDVGAISTIVEIINLTNTAEKTRLRWFDTNLPTSNQSEQTERQLADPTQSNFWGVTFSNNDHFYVTYNGGDETQIYQGSLSKQTVEPTGITGSCPSLSPNGTKLAYKKQQEDGTFLLSVKDMETGVETLVNEPRNVDDQVEWLDEDTLLYALHTSDEPAELQPEFDIWSIDIEPNAQAELYLPNADSPAVYRTN